jgi:hypothetical protein
MNNVRGWMVAFAMLVLAAGVQAQSAEKAPMSDEQLTQTIKKLDAEVFDAYNKCELEKFGSYFTEELEFYHDSGGLTNRTRQSLVDAVKKNICGKVHRELVSVEVYPLRGYGAVEVGVHRFTHPGIDNEMGEAQFVQVWQNNDGKWQMTRVISFDHHAVK